MYFCIGWFIGSAIRLPSIAEFIYTYMVISHGALLLVADYMDVISGH